MYSRFVKRAKINTNYNIPNSLSMNALSVIIWLYDIIVLFTKGELASCNQSVIDIILYHMTLYYEDHVYWTRKL